MEPLPLIPCNENTITKEMGCLVREVFQKAFEAETATWQISINFLKSCQQNSELREIAEQIQTEFTEHEETLSDLEYAEIQIMKSQGYHLCRAQGIASNERAMEIIRLKRHPLYIDLQPNITEKYPLLQSDDFLPPMHECATDFRLDKKERIKMKKRLYKSRDSLLDEISLPVIPARGCRFGSIVEQKSRHMRTKKRSVIRKATVYKRSIIRSDYIETVLIAEPQELFFHNFEYNKLYKKTVVLKNVSNSMARYKIERRAPNSKFTVLFNTATAVEAQKIAPGMHVKLTILFKCDTVEDPEEFLIVNVHLGKTLCIKMRGYRDPPLLRVVKTPEQSRSCHQICNTDMKISYSSMLTVFGEKGGNEIHGRKLAETLENIERYGLTGEFERCNLNLGATFECGKCFLGERIIVTRKFVNDGGNGKFFIMSEIDWCTMNIDDIVDCNMIFIPPFALWPIYFTLKSGECIVIRTYFCPESYGMQVDKLYILCDNYAVYPIELMGDGLLFDANFICFGDNMEKYPENDDKTKNDYCLNMGVASSGETLRNSVSITNTSGLEVYYRWEKQSVKYGILSSKSNRTDLPIENLYVEPDRGFLYSDFKTSFKVIVKTEDLQPSEYLTTLRLYIEDIPLAAIPKDCDLAITECCRKRRNCPITVDILFADIDVWVHCIPEKDSLYPDIEKTESENSNGWSLDKAREQNITNDNYSPSSSITDTRDSSREFFITDDKTLICGIEGVQCNKDYKDMKNSENLWNISFNVVENSEVNTVAPAVPMLDFQYQKENTAILIPDRILYVGMKKSYILRLKNLICKPVSYAWGKPSEVDEHKMKVNFIPNKGLIPPKNTATIEIICLPMDTGKLDHFYVPCFIGGQQNPIMLRIECSIEALYVTFLFLPTSNSTLSPCDDYVRVEWHKNGHTSALNLNNWTVNQNSKADKERELKNIDLDAGQGVATTAVGSTFIKTENISTVSVIETTSSAIKHNFQKTERISKPEKKIDKRDKLKDNGTVEFESEKEEPAERRSWESLLKGIVWTVDKPDEFITLSKPKFIVPFYKTIVPPITPALAIEFVDLPLQTVDKRTFVIRNETPAKSKFLITLKQFGIAKIVEQLNSKDIINITYATVIGNKSENYWEEIKPPGQGVVLVIEPMSGDLASYETVPIDIYVYADTWGVYIDEITVAITGLPEYIFGVCIQVVGSPIAYPICKTGINKTPILRFGTVSLGTENVTRKLLIENTSTVTLNINWYSYLIDSRVIENSTPFNVMLLMFSPFTNKIANITCTDSINGHDNKDISTDDCATEESQTSILISKKYDSLKSTETIKKSSSLSYCCQSEILQPEMYLPFRKFIIIPIKNFSYHLDKLYSSFPTSGLTWHKYYSENCVSHDDSLSGNKKKEKECSSNRSDLANESMEYTTESEIKTVNWSEQTIDKETDLELAIIPYYGKPDYSVFTVTPPELIIPAKEKRSIEITLNAVNSYIPNNEGEVCGHLMGFIRVAPMHKYKADCYSRSDGIMLPPTEIQLEAIITQPVPSCKISNSDTIFKMFEN